MFSLKTMKYQYVIHQMTAFIFPYQLIWKSYFLTFIFGLSIIITTNNVLYDLTFVGNIRLKGTVSDFRFRSFFFFLCQKAGIFYIFWNIIFLNFIENEPGPISKI